MMKGEQEVTAPAAWIEQVANGLGGVTAARVNLSLTFRAAERNSAGLCGVTIDISGRDSAGSGGPA
jgi:hypothetical protein